ncbi:hypothetical protein [Sphingomonas colocasiae]|uniref:Uncharacterized protein n=1 Tax=Sphingomonas colocasiae TaxID=1848973 RepID=A0ABS7PQ95_9SPHN|nr:hypothetical protein [Sphingomonas colocasiae]MBY8823398.1 hypothetical protein [Sphingomonas colocasiae]
MTPEHERWAFAAKLLDVHRSRIGRFIEGRAAHYRRLGDEDALAFWEDITEKLIQLMGPEDGRTH